MTTTSADVPMKGLVPLLEALAKVRTERDDAELVIIGKPKGKSKIPALIERLGLTGAVRYVSGVTTERIVELYAEAEVAVVPSLYEGFSLPDDRGHGVRRAAWWRPPAGRCRRWSAPTARPACWCRPGEPDALALALLRALGDADLRARLGEAGPRPGPRQVHLAGHRGRDGRELPGAARRPGRSGAAAGAGTGAGAA